MSTSTSPSRPRSPAIEAAASDWVTRCDAGLTAAEQQIFQDWLVADARHADSFYRLSEAWSVFDRVQEGGVISAVLGGLARRAQRRRTRRIQAAAAACVVLVVGLIFSRSPEASPVHPQDSALSPQIAQSILPDSVRQLPDGSIVELKTGAEIAVNYEADARRVTLVHGEAFFRVAKDSARPFFVEANGVVVRAIGTAFSVQAQPHAVEVVVQEGSVDVVRSTATMSDNDPIRLGAGQKVVMRAMLLRPAMRAPSPAPAPATGPTEPAVENLSDNELDQRLAWRDTRQELNGVTLYEAVALFNRRNITQITLNDPAVGQLRVSGYFRTDNPEGFVRVVEESFGLKVEELGGHTFLLRAEP